MCTNTLMNYFFGTQMVFQQERPIFLREQANKLYDVCPYFITKNLIDFPVACVTPAILMVILFWFVGFDHSFE